MLSQEINGPIPYYFWKINESIIWFCINVVLKQASVQTWSGGRMSEALWLRSSHSRLRPRPRRPPSWRNQTMSHMLQLCAYFHYSSRLHSWCRGDKLSFNSLWSFCIFFFTNIFLVVVVASVSWYLVTLFMLSIRIIIQTSTTIVIANRKQTAINLIKKCMTLNGLTTSEKEIASCKKNCYLNCLNCRRMRFLTDNLWLEPVIRCWEKQGRKLYIIWICHLYYMYIKSQKNNISLFV